MKTERTLINALDVDRLGELTKQMAQLKKATLADLRKLTEKRIRDKSQVRMLENDLARCPSFLWFGDQWETLFKSWLEKGAQVEVYFQAPRRKTLEMLKRLKSQHKGSFYMIPFSDVPEGVLKTEKDLTREHFTLIEVPRAFAGGTDKYMWTEGEHNPGNSSMKDCHYFQSTSIGAHRKGEYWEPDFKRNAGILNRILEYRGMLKKPKSKRISVRG